MIDNCRNHFELIIDLIHSIKFLVKEITPKSENSKMQEMIQGFGKIIPHINSNKMMQLIEQAKTDENAKIEVCNNLYNLNGLSFLEVVVLFFRKFARKIDEIFEGMIVYGKRNGFKFARSLQSLTLSNWINPFENPGSTLKEFISDITVLKVVDDSNSKPMNLSLAFP